jgi:ABC-type Fe3+-hydroxamate transport system substrate-binding protein
MSETDQDYQKRIEELEAQLAAEKAKQNKAVYLKVSEKGGASLYGIRRFPITFYVEEWNRILNMAGEIRKFLDEHDEELTRKP